MRLIDADYLKGILEDCNGYLHRDEFFEYMEGLPELDLEKTLRSEYQNGYWNGYNDTMAKTWTNHQVACLLVELFNDTCACNYCGIDEWLPQKCDFASKECPDVIGVACWEQFLKHRK